jgi:hypothetical protein
METLAETCTRLGNCYQSYRRTQRSRIVIENRLRAEIAVDLGYYSRLDEAKREELFAQARGIIDAITSGEEGHDAYRDLVESTHLALDQFAAREKGFKSTAEKIAKKLPVAEWATAPEQKGFGLFSLAKIVGECGDLTSRPGKPEEGGNYESPAKLWKRMCLAPFSFREQTHMGCTWRVYGGRKEIPALPASEWSAYGYSGRRRSVMYTIGESLLKANDGPYRERYLAAKVAAYQNHPDWNWTDCTKCEGNGKAEGATCRTCGGTGKKSKHAHLHAMLLMEKLLLKTCGRRGTLAGRR